MNFLELEKKYLELCEKVEDGEEIPDAEEYVLYTICGLNTYARGVSERRVKDFFNAVYLVLKTEIDNSIYN